MVIRQSTINLMTFFRFSIWTPDIVLINASGNGDEGMEKRTLVKVHI